MTAPVNNREYAEHRGVSRTAVRKAIKQGRIHTTPEEKIGVGQADRDWDRNTTPTSKPMPAPAPKQPERPLRAKQARALFFPCLSRQSPFHSSFTNKDLPQCFALACGAAKSVHVTVVNATTRRKELWTRQY